MAVWFVCTNFPKDMLLTFDREWDNLIGKYPRVLLVTCALDGNNKILPVAYDIIENERYDT